MTDEIIKDIAMGMGQATSEMLCSTADSIRLDVLEKKSSINERIISVEKRLDDFSEKMQAFIAALDTDTKQDDKMALARAVDALADRHTALEHEAWRAERRSEKIWEYIKTIGIGTLMIVIQVVVAFLQRGL